MLTVQDFEKLGFWEDSTPEENITVYGMDFEKTYVTLTDIDGKTPTDPNKPLIMAAYDDANCFLWFSEFSSFAALAKVCAKSPADREELFLLFEENCVK